MSVAVTAPLTIPQVLDRGFQLFKQALLQILPLTLIASILNALPELIFPPHKGADGVVGQASGFWGLWLLASIGSFPVVIAAIRKVDDIAEGRNALSLMEAYRGGLRMLPAVAGGSVLFMLALIGGMIALVIPGIIWSVSLSFFWFCIIFENKGPLDAIKGSRELVRGQWWRCVAIYTVAMAVFVGVYAGLGYLTTLSVKAASGGEIPTGLLIGKFVTQVVVSCISTPLLYSVQLICFRDLQLRKGGADLAARIAQAA